MHVHIAQHVEDPNARMPYSKIQEYGIRMEGLPSGKTLKNPTAYGKTTLQDIIANKDSLKLHGNILQKPTIIMIEIIYLSNIQTW